MTDEVILGAGLGIVAVFGFVLAPRVMTAVVGLSVLATMLLWLFWLAREVLAIADGWERVALVGVFTAAGGVMVVRLVWHVVVISPPDKPPINKKAHDAFIKERTQGGA